MAEATAGSKTATCREMSDILVMAETAPKATDGEDAADTAEAKNNQQPLLETLQSAAGKPPRTATRKVVVPFPSEAELQALSNQCNRLIASVAPDLNEAAELARRVNASITSELSTAWTSAMINNTTAAAAFLAASSSDNTIPPASQAQTVVTQSSTGGFSNVNHVIVCTGDYETDRICQLKRAMILRVSAQQPESKGEDRWDKPRVIGQRRRRIVREKDAVEAPPEPPPSGYVIFLGQMTIKMRHDRPNQPHNQAEVMTRVSKMWRDEISESDREYYKRFSEEARLEYKQKSLEFRATGTFEPSETFDRQAGVGLWTRKKMHEKNALEREIASYETVIFPRRPPEMDEAYNMRMKESLERRKQKTRVPEEKRKRGRINAKKNKKKKAPPPPVDNEAGNEEQNQQESDAPDAFQAGMKVEEANELLVKQPSASSGEEMSQSSQDPTND